MVSHVHRSVKRKGPGPAADLRTEEGFLITRRQDTVLREFLQKPKSRAALLGLLGRREGASGCPLLY